MAKETKEASPFSRLSQPARRALASAGIDNLRQLSQWTEQALLQLHGLGKASLPVLREALQAEGLSFATQESGR